ncbi:MAG: 2Fe-2S iron-sulfur cluster-binding protein [Hyphomicrobiaceae bacterium]
MSAQDTLIARLSIARRKKGASAARKDTFEVPFEAGQSVLDGLRWIRVHVDPTLSFRFSCISANACKECMMEVDGEVVYACLARLEPREMHLAPLSNKPLVRDLVTEIAPPPERFAGKRT